MRKIVAGLFMTLNGVVESPGTWSIPYLTEEVGQVIGSAMDASDTMLLGRRTYEEWAAYWPDKTAADDPFADYINDVPKVVVSTTLKSVEWRNSTLLGDNIVDEIGKLKQQSGKGIAISGSITLVGSLLRDGLLDELSLLVHPIVLGSGKRLFVDPDGRVQLKLVGARTFDNGVQSVRYQPA